MPGILGDGQNFKRRDKDDNVEGGGGVIVLLFLLCNLIFIIIKLCRSFNWRICTLGP